MREVFFQMVLVFLGYALVNLIVNRLVSGARFFSHFDCDVFVFCIGDSGLSDSNGSSYDSDCFYV
jgi:hypothetical protein